MAAPLFQAARARMLDVAAEYERKAKQADALEVKKPENK
jgi:hypothetical protein